MGSLLKKAGSENWSRDKRREERGGRKRVIRERECYQGQGGGLHGRRDEIRVLGRTYEGNRESGATVEKG